MKRAVVEVGPQTVRGPNAAPQDWISVAIECVDDQIGLLDDRLVEVRRLWSDLLERVAGPRTETLVLVFPTWWSSARVELVTDAARKHSVEVIVQQRSSILATDSRATVVEFAEDFVVIAAPAADVEVLPRTECDIVTFLGAAPEVLIDVPATVSPPAPALAAQLRAGGIAVAHNDRHRMLRAVDVVLPEPARPVPASTDSGPRRRVVAVFAGAVLSVGAVVGGWAAQALSGGQPPADTASTLLVEGRIGVRVPADWAVERITSGPGSARLRVSAPTGGATALHVTQSAGAPSTTLAEVGESLRSAIESEPAGVFADFDPGGSVGGRPAVTYRELRAGSQTTWAVVIDGAIRIAVGCQSPPGRPDAIHDACVRAVRTAHEVR